MMKLFISYARVDKPLIRQLADLLRSAGLDPWFDHLLTPGRKWQEQLSEVIVKCDAFVYALTPESVKSEWCQWEFAEAVRLGKPVIPVLMQARTELPDVLKPYHYADCSDGFTAQSIAQVMNGLWYARTVIPRGEMPAVPTPLNGVPASANVDPSSNSERGEEQVTRNKVFVPDEVRKELEELTRRTLDILPPPFEWCYIPAGNVTNEQWKEKTVHVPAFAMAKYPVTNAQYEVFVQAKDGYSDAKWWDYSNEAVKWRKEHRQATETAFEGIDLPLTGVTWYESVAFARWLTIILRRGGSRVSIIGSVILPSEQQWQRAAQGDDERVYPWGNTFEDGRCNYGRKVRGPTPVTRYPSGASPFGVMDMSGNILEWCLTKYATVSNELEGWDVRVQRGCSWNEDSANYLHTDHRYREDADNWDYPHNRNAHAGFRVANSFNSAH